MTSQIVPIMMNAWFNMTATVRRRDPNAARNALNEPSYGTDASLPVVYTDMPLRIEYQDEMMEFNQAGERITVDKLIIFVDPDYTIVPEDRFTITGADAASLIGSVYIVTAVYPEWDGMGFVHHYIVEVNVH